MSNIKPSSSNPFIQQADRIARTTPVDGNTPIERPSRKSKFRAQLNFIPDDMQLSALIDRALEMVRSGRILDRGTVLNLLV